MPHQDSDAVISTVKALFDLCVSLCNHTKETISVKSNSNPFSAQKAPCLEGINVQDEMTRMV